ncbi:MULTISPECIES: hypothetical protein [Ralstonia solanacearum species complex]|uniref:hypothetical protein n=1 Tax=Ralstonia solanacearum species complex TaxID=3116862 RepID=UPI001071A854|nr:hypothetical protein [Ralstonia solanacearum]
MLLDESLDRRFQAEFDFVVPSLLVGKSRLILKMYQRGSDLVTDCDYDVLVDVELAQLFSAIATQDRTALRTPPRPPFRRLRAMEKQTVLGLRDPESAGRVFESLTPHQIEKRLRAIGALFVCPRTLNEIRPAATQPAKPAQASRTSAVSAAPCPW